MVNPWEEISLSDYENHMQLDSVMQLQNMMHIFIRLEFHKEVQPDSRTGPTAETAESAVRLLLGQRE